MEKIKEIALEVFVGIIFVIVAGISIYGTLSLPPEQQKMIMLMLMSNQE